MFVVAWADAVLGAAKISNASEPIIKTTLIFMLDCLQELSTCESFELP